MHPDVEDVLYTEEQLSERIHKLGRQISADYAGREPVFVGILSGSFIFMADLVRACDLTCTVDFMSVSSYGSGTVSSGKINIKKDLSHSIEGRDVIIVEDILDTGNTLYHLKDYLRKYHPASVRVAVLLDKPERRTADITADYAGFTVPDAFIVGYGLDYDQRYRSLPYIGVLKPSVYS